MKKIQGILAVFILVFSIVFFSVPPVMAESDSMSVDIMFTSDIHSHLNSFTTIIEGDQKKIGGAARIQTLIKNQKTKNNDTLLVDGGDFSMGTMIQTLFTTDAAELSTLGYMGYDFVTLGNHEFDYGSEMLAEMFGTATAKEHAMPRLVCCNIDWSGELSENQLLLKNAFEKYGIAPYFMTEKNGVKIAVIGVFGKDSLACAPTCELKFLDPQEAVKQTISDIKANEQADMIVLLSHSGLDGKSGKSEDELMAKANPEIDVIVAGHSHTTLKEEIKIGDTHIVACGEYGEWVGSLSVEKKSDGRWGLKEYKLISVDSDIADDVEIKQLVEKYNQRVKENYLSLFGSRGNGVIAKNNIRFSSVSQVYKDHTDQNLGNFIADAYAYAVKKKGISVDLAVSPSGTIRETIPVGDITLEEIYNIYPLGIGADGVFGHPLVKIYLYGHEIKAVLEIDASVSDFMTNARLYFSGVDYSFNPHRIYFDRVTDSSLIIGDAKVPIEDDKLYSFVVDMYSGQMIGAVKDKSFGIISVVPKDENGIPIKDYNDAIIHDADGKEIKAWDAIATYMESFEKGADGIPVIPETYEQGKNVRKIVVDDNSTKGVLGKPGKSTIIVVVAVPLLSALLITLVVLIVRIIRKIVKGKKRA